MRELVGHQRPKSNAALGGLVAKTPDELGGSTTSAPRSSISLSSLNRPSHSWNVTNLLTKNDAPTHHYDGEKYHNSENRSDRLEGSLPFVSTRFFKHTVLVAFDALSEFESVNRTSLDYIGFNLRPVFWCFISLFLSRDHLVRPDALSDVLTDSTTLLSVRLRSKWPSMLS